MRHVAARGLWTALLLTAVCLPVRAAEEDGVKEAFVAFQAALKARDADKLWDLLAADSQAGADRIAKTLREGYGKAGAEEKAKQEKALGLTAEEMGKLTGKVYLKSKRFHGKYHEVPGSKLDKVTIEGETATVNYTEDDGDKEKLPLARQGGKWKVAVRVP